MGESLPLRFLYRTAPGRMVLKLLVRPGLSRAVGAFLDSGLSRPLIRPFLRSNQIDLTGIAIPEGGFPSFNACFSRRREETPFDPEPAHFCSPCDSLLSVVPIDANSTFQIKHTAYSLEALLEDAALARDFQGGTALIFRLTPAHYHRYHFADGGRILRQVTIPGVLHCVRPIAMEQFPVYIRNSRAYTLYDSEQFGRLVQMEVGALLVGRIVNHPDPGRFVRGQEKGWFAFGGSTIVVLARKNALLINDCILDGLQGNQEIPVRLGQWIGTKP